MWDAGGGQPRDFDTPGHWGRLTAEPRPGWYSHRAVVELAAGGWTLLPATAGYPYGTAHATDPAQDMRPARGANGETGLKTGTADGLVVWLVFDAVKKGYRFAVGGGGAGMPLVPVVQTAATATTGGTYTAGTVQVFDASGSLVAGTEAVLFTPDDPTMLQKTGTRWWCVDTGATDGGTPPKRKLRGVVPPWVKRQVQVGCEGATPLYANLRVPDVN